MRTLYIFITPLCLLCTKQLFAQEQLYWNSRNFINDTSTFQVQLHRSESDFSSNASLSSWTGNNPTNRNNIHAYFEHKQDLLNVQYRSRDYLLQYRVNLFQRNSLRFSGNLFNVLLNNSIDSTFASYGQSRLSSINHELYGERKLNDKATIGFSLYLHSQNSINIKEFEQGVVDNRSGGLFASFEGYYQSYNTPGIDSTASVSQHGVGLRTLELPHVTALLPKNLSPSLGIFLALEPTNFTRVRFVAERIGPSFLINLKSRKTGYEIEQNTIALSPEDLLGPNSNLNSTNNYSEQVHSFTDSQIRLMRQPTLLGGSFEVDYSKNISLIAAGSLKFYPEYTRTNLQLLTKVKASSQQFFLFGAEASNTHLRIHRNIFTGISTHVHKRLILSLSTKTLFNLAYLQREFGPAPTSRHQFQLSAFITIP